MNILVNCKHQDLEEQTAQALSKSCQHAEVQQELLDALVLDQNIENAVYLKGLWFSVTCNGVCATARQCGEFLEAGTIFYGSLELCRMCWMR